MPWFHGPPNGDAESLADLAESVRRAQIRLRSDVDANPAHAGMATTLTMALVAWPKLHIAHVGDSRAYLWREDRLERLTRDHTVEAALEGSHPSARRVLWNVVTAEVEPKPDTRAVRLEPDDLVLLCTDGLTSHLTDEAIASRLRAEVTAERVARALVDAVLARGGRDNVTVVAARVVRRHSTPSSPALVQDANELEDTHIQEVTL
jgi:protein phosphatase